MNKRKIGIIGATGSIGRQTLDVIGRHRDQFEVVFVTAHRNAKALNEAAEQAGTPRKVLTGNGMDELLAVIDASELDMVLVGAAGTDIMVAAYELVKKGVTLAVANKECLVSAGNIIMAEARRNHSMIIPVDSEHSALFQCMTGHRPEDIACLTLTASGGAFRDMEIGDLKHVTVTQALAHPNWKMGKKITIDSATMMNKGLELIEARVLFDIEPARLEVVIHPQSIIHSMVSYIDGSVLAQMGEPDMRVPIAYALGYPERISSGVKPLDFRQAMELTFYPPDLEKYPCLALALEVLRSDKQVPRIVMNAGNEIAVESFLEGRLSFGGICSLIGKTLESFSLSEPNTLEDVLHIDKMARIKTRELISAGI